MATVTPVSPARAANPLAGQAADPAGDDWANTGKELLLVEHTNGAGSDVTLTVATTVEIDSEPVADKEIVIPAGQRHLLGPFPANIYNDGDGKAGASYDDATDIEVAVIQTS